VLLTRLVTMLESELRYVNYVTMIN